MIVRAAQPPRPIPSIGDDDILYDEASSTTMADGALLFWTTMTMTMRRIRPPSLLFPPATAAGTTWLIGLSYNNYICMCSLIGRENIIRKYSTRLRVQSPKNDACVDEDSAWAVEKSHDASRRHVIPFRRPQASHLAPHKIIWL